MGNIVKNTTFASLFDLLAPHSCLGCGRIGKVLCECCKKHILSTRHNLCPICHKPNLTGRCVDCAKLPPTFVVDRKSSLVGDLIHDFKYHSRRALAMPLAELLDSTLPSIDGHVAIVPLPTISRHIRERGFDHTLLVARRLARIRTNFFVHELLIRIGNTVQVGADRSVRLKQVAMAYDINSKFVINPEVAYLLLDDVWTTGASMEAAYKKLRQAGAKNVFIAVLALSGL